MRLLNKSKKRRQQKRLTTRKYIKSGGSENDTSQHKTPEQIMNEVENPPVSNAPSIISNIMNSPIVEKTEDLAEGVTLNVINKAGDLIGVDLSDKEQIHEQLDNIKSALTNPETTEKIKDIALNVGELGVEVGKELLPIAKPLVSQVAESTGKALSKTASAFVTTGINFIKATPLGIPLILAEDASKFAQAGLATGAAVADVTKATANATRASLKTLEQFSREKQDLINKTEESIKEFANPPSSLITEYKKGGKTKKKLIKNKRPKTKRVHFLL
jgi:hypothetical protein